MYTCINHNNKTCCQYLRDNTTSEDFICPCMYTLIHARMEIQKNNLVIQ